MKRKLMSVISILVVAVLSACGTAATPTMSVGDLQGTAIADAWIAMTMTQAAIPTATQTPIPPTPTMTFTPQPTLVLIPTVVPPTLPDTAAVNPCNEPPPADPKGAVVKIKFINKSGGNISPLSFGMMDANALKECGTYSFSLAKFDEPEVAVLAGCYWGMAYTDLPSIAKTVNALCITDTTKTTAIWITNEVISFH
jgi:hypothetical protein